MLEQLPDTGDVLQITDLPDTGDVLQITDESDTDFRKVFIYYGNLYGNHIIAQAGEPENPLVVEQLPEYQVLLSLGMGNRSAPKDSSKKAIQDWRGIISTLFSDASQDIAAHTAFLEEARELGLQANYDARKLYSEKDNDSGYISRVIGSGIIFAEPRDSTITPKGSLIRGHYISYRLSDKGVWVNTRTDWKNLSDVFEIGWILGATREQRKNWTGRFVSEERTKEIFDTLVGQGVHVENLLRALRSVHADFYERPQAFVDRYEPFSVTIAEPGYADLNFEARTEFEDPTEELEYAYRFGKVPERKYFQTLKEAREHMRNLAETLKK